MIGPIRRATVGALCALTLTGAGAGLAMAEPVPALPTQIPEGVRPTVDKFWSLYDRLREEQKKVDPGKVIPGAPALPMPDLPRPGGKTEAPVGNVSDKGADYVTETGKAVVEHQNLKPGQIGYCDLDKLKRATCAYGSLTADTRKAAQSRGRQDITVDPAGWPKTNPKVSIPAKPDVPGSKPYKGFAVNRSHLLADSLGGEASAKNLVTGTRTQNVGSTQNKGQAYGGMAMTEAIARDYLGNPNANKCPLYYAAKPVYQGDELVPRTVTVDIRSCDGKIDKRVTVFNTAQGLDINYRTGEVREVK